MTSFPKPRPDSPPHGTPSNAPAPTAPVTAPAAGATPNRIKRQACAVLAGLATAIILVALIESAGHTLYPPPDDLDFHDKDQLAQFVESLPAALLFVLAAWLIGALVGGWLAATIARRRPLLYAGIVGAFVLVASVFNLLTIPHPLWFSIAAVVLIPIMTYLASRLAKKQSPAPPTS